MIVYRPELMFVIIFIDSNKQNISKHFQIPVTVLIKILNKFRKYKNLYNIVFRNFIVMNFAHKYPDMKKIH